MPDSKISVVINTYNAEKHLEEVLRSVKDFDEVLICDMESTDQTLEIARKFGCRVITFPKGEHKICEPARDFAIHSAECPWVFVVDADEIVPEKLRQYLYDAISDDNFEAAFAVPRINRFMGVEIKSSPDYQLRFFKKDNAKWPNIIHARPVISGEIRNIPFKKELSLHHLDDPVIARRIDKMNVYSDYEVPKREHKKYGVSSLLFRPLWFFVKSFIIGQGFRSGMRGIVNAYMTSFYQVILLAKLFENQLADKSER